MCIQYILSLPGSYLACVQYTVTTSILPCSCIPERAAWPGSVRWGAGGGSPGSSSPPTLLYQQHLLTLLLFITALYVNNALKKSNVELEYKQTILFSVANSLCLT
jgi:hypothetical protein